jgi:hypothetical protein
MLTLLAAPVATSSAFRVDDETIRITIQKKEKQEKEKDDQEKDSTKRHRHRHRINTEEDDDEGEDGGKPAVTLLSGTYDPRGPQFGSLRQYTLSSQGVFLDYLTGAGATKAEVIGVGMNGGAFIERRSNAPVSPFLNWGWGVYHARGTSSETKLAWRLGMGITTKVGFVAKLQLLDTKLKNGDLRGSSLTFGWRF